MRDMNLPRDVSGFFGDIPYCSPVESSLFYDVVASARLHRVSEAMMTKTNSTFYFFTDISKFSTLLGEINTNISYIDGVSKSNMGIMDVVPAWLTSLTSQRIYSGSVNRTCFMTIDLIASRDDNCSLSPSTRVIRVMPWNMREIDQMWNSLWMFLLGESVSSEEYLLYTLPDVDLFLSAKNPYGRFMFSIWAMGVSCILHFFDSVEINSIRERLNRVNIRMTLLKGTVSEIVADDIHLFLENKLRIAVERVQVTSEKDECVKYVKTESFLSASTVEEWCEKMSELVINTHESLCDSYDENLKSNDRTRSCILVLLPEIKLLRYDLEKCLSDSYTSIPILVAASQKQVYHLISQPEDQQIPITIFASRQVLEDQLLLPEHEQFFKWLDVKTVIISDEDSCARDCVILRWLTKKSLELHVVQCPHIAVYKEEEVDFSKENELEKKFLYEGMNLLLLVFRRFKLPLSKNGVKPIIHSSLTAFLSQDAYSYFYEVINSLQTNGLISFEETNGSFSFALEALGRLLSYRFRMPYEREHPELTVFDCKCVIWSHALRQSKQTPQELISKVHYAPFWVQDAVDAFCLRHRIVLENEVPLDLKGLVQDLSQGVQATESCSRVKLFLRNSSGTREPISKHMTSNSSTSCRGWFDQAPMDESIVALPKPHVTIYCYPSQNELCEIHSGGQVLQCPLDLSYPLIVAHIVLHTALRNNAIFLEYDQCLEPVPLLSLPLSVLQSPTFRSFLESGADDSVGYWLDSCIGDNPVISDPMELSSLMAKTNSLLGMCNRSLLRRKRLMEDESVVKRPKEELSQKCKPTSAADAAAIEEFAKAALKLGRESAEKRFKGVRGFAFLDPLHENHPYYLSLLEGDPN